VTRRNGASQAATVDSMASIYGTKHIHVKALIRRQHADPRGLADLGTAAGEGHAWIVPDPSERSIRPGQAWRHPPRLCLTRGGDNGPYGFDG